MTTPVTGTFTATGQSSTFRPETKPGSSVPGFNLDLRGTFAATVQLERSFDNGANWNPVSRDSSGTVAAFTGPASVVAEDPEPGVVYRLNCTAYTSGTVNYRLSQ